MSIILFDNHRRQHLFPFTLTRPIADIRVGILTIRQKWEKWLNASSSTLTESYLAAKYPMVTQNENLFINGAALPSASLVRYINYLQTNQILVANNEVIAARLDAKKTAEFVATQSTPAGTQEVPFAEPIELVSRPYQLFMWADKWIKQDFEILTAGRKSAPISATNKVIAPENVFIEEGAIVECSILNATDSRIYIGKQAEIMEGCMIRGSFSLGEHSQLKMGAKIYGATSIGPYCKVGGEVNNCLIFGYSNKAHDGFIGNSVIGEWCNLGADTNTSNLKNNYANVKLWSYAAGKFEDTGTQFCGLMMGDHSKCGINTMFNTGTVVGVSCNIFGDGFPRNYIPDFTWGGNAGFETYSVKKAVETAILVYKRRGMEFDNVEQQIFQSLFDLTAASRKD